MSHYTYSGPKWTDFFNKPEPKEEQESTKELIVEQDHSAEGEVPTEVTSTESSSITTNDKVDSDLVIDKTEPDVFIEPNIIADIAEEGSDQQKDKPKRKRRKRKKN